MKINSIVNLSQVPQCHLLHKTLVVQRLKANHGSVEGIQLDFSQ
jgi:hypothetical protein